MLGSPLGISDINLSTVPEFSISSTWDEEFAAIFANPHAASKQIDLESEVSKEVSFWMKMNPVS